MDAGPDTIGWHLTQHHQLTVSRATISRYLVKAGLVVAEPKKRPKSSYVRFAAEQPNECWQSDFTHYRLTTTDGCPGADVEIITWLDDHSRMVLHLSTHTRITGKIVVTTFTETVAQHGVPASTSPITAWCTPPDSPAVKADGTDSKPNSAASTPSKKNAGDPDLYADGPGMTPLAGLEKGEPHEPIVRFGMRSCDRQWIFKDPRLAKTESPSLWAAVSDRQIFLTTMTTTSLGAGPAATLTTSVPDKHHFRGSYGGKDVVPLYRDAAGTPNVDPELLSLLSARLGQRVSIEQLFAYTFGVPAGTDYTERFHDALETPGPRIPLTADASLFTQMAVHGEKLIWLQTFAERFGTGKLPTAGIAWKSTPSRLPEAKSDIAYEAATETLRVADGILHGLPEAAWNFEVSGMDVIPKWLGYRMAKPAGRAASSDSPLDRIRPMTWSPGWSTELIEIVAALKETLAMIPDGVALLDEIIARPLIASDELPPVPPVLRQPPKTIAPATGEGALFGALPGMNLDEELF